MRQALALKQTIASPLAVKITDGEKADGMKEAVQFEFSGAIVPDSFVEFARHRAKRLDIWLKICSTAPDSVTLDVQGDADLVDAFEMACSLGPQDCIILDVSRRDLPDYDLERT